MNKGMLGLVMLAMTNAVIVTVVIADLASGKKIDPVGWVGLVAAMVVLDAILGPNLWRAYKDARRSAASEPPASK